MAAKIKIQVTVVISDYCIADSSIHFVSTRRGWDSGGWSSGRWGGGTVTSSTSLC